MKTKQVLPILIFLLMIAFLATGCPSGTSETTATTTIPTTTATTTTAVTRKPVIYLYPLEKTDVTITLDYDGQLTCTYPAYNGQWQVTAWPDGTLLNKSDGKVYSYLYWEGLTDAQYDFSRGFTVRGQDTAAFLQEKLAFLGLTPKEYNEFIVYWLPFMQENPYNLISFQNEAYTSHATLTISPKPDSILRVFMAWKPLKENRSIREQTLVPFNRKGFTVVEWGGSLIQ